MRSCACGTEIPKTRSRCNPCNREYLREYKTRPEYNRRKYDLKSRYGLTWEEYELLFEKQGGRCAICRTDDFTVGRGIPYVDHCHNSGRVRGILCHKCNSAISLLRDDPGLLRVAADYLES